MQIKAAGVAHQTEPLDCWRAWVTDGHGLYRWSRRTFDTEMDARNYGFRWVFRFELIFGTEDDTKTEVKE